MPNEHAISIDLSGSSIVVQLGVGECTGLEVINLELRGEGLVRWDLAKVEGEDEFGRGDLGLGDYASLGNWVA
jgi:hypothetical protein